MPQSKPKALVRWWSLGLWLTLLAAGPALGQADSPPPAPQRVVSINLCSDQWALSLLPAQRISSVTFLARNPHASLHWKKASEIAINHGELEQVLSFAPDLVIGQAGTNARVLAKLKQFGIKTLALDYLQTLEQVRAEIPRLAEALGAPLAGERLLAKFDQQWQKLKAQPAPKPLPRALLLHARGYSAGSGSLRNTLLALAGWENHATTLGLSAEGRVSLEQIATEPPDALILSPYAPGTASYAQRFLQHPAVTGHLSQRPRYTVPNALWMCHTPSLLEAARLLQQHRQTLLSEQGLTDTTDTAHAHAAH